MKSINTLVSDIQQRLVSGKSFDEETVTAFAHNLAKKLANRLSEAYKSALRLSNIGTKCDRKLWYSINYPELAEPLPASARLKFLYGDILEEVVLFQSDGKQKNRLIRLLTRFYLRIVFPY